SVPRHTDGAHEQDQPDDGATGHISTLNDDRIPRRRHPERRSTLNAAHTAFELISLDEARPRVVGVATIEPYSELDARRDLHAVFAASPVHALAS
ncbi:hypothetical protein WN67_28425, partial [Mycolicibacterium obuense]